MRDPMQLRRYHKDIYLPSDINSMAVQFYHQLKNRILVPTQHAQVQFNVDKRGIIPTPTFTQLFDSKNTLIEVYEILDNNNQPTGIIQKALIRCSNLSNEFDYSYVVAREGFIVSGWANDKGDNHRLNFKHHMYYKPANNNIQKGFNGKNHPINRRKLAG